jgi:hypothetical protein
MISPQIFIEQPLLIIRRCKLHNQKSRSSLLRSFHFWGADKHRALTKETLNTKNKVNTSSVDNKHQNIIYSGNALSTMLSWNKTFNVHYVVVIHLGLCITFRCQMCGRYHVKIRVCIFVREEHWAANRNYA